MEFDFRFEGNLAEDPELRITEGGKTVCQLRVGHGTRRRNRDGEWENGPTMWVTVTAWEALAERCADLKKGNTVIVTGRDDLRVWSFTRRDSGDPAGLLQVTAANVALSLRFKGAQVVENDDTPWADEQPHNDRDLQPAL